LVEAKLFLVEVELFLVEVELFLVEGKLFGRGYLPETPQPLSNNSTSTKQLNLYQTTQPLSETTQPLSETT
jgi:hypothetical protein